jgi:pimeloyl-ACP methyl ester carboxylesterase
MTPVIKTVQLHNQLNIPYAEQGDYSSIPLILLHGYADSWRSFERLLLHMPDSVHTFAITQRGHSDASRPPKGYSSYDFAGDLEAFMDKLGINNAVIAGGSSGGFAARRFAIDHPQRTKGLVLLGSPLSLRDKPVVLEMWDSTISELTDPIDPGFVRQFVESTFIQQVPQELIEILVQESLKVPARVWKAVLEGLLEDESAEEIGKIQSPTLIVWGEQDTIVSRNEQETIAEAIPGSRLVVYPGAGHALYYEEPARIASELVAFIANID